MGRGKEYTVTENLLIEAYQNYLSSDRKKKPNYKAIAELLERPVDSVKWKLRLITEPIRRAEKEAKAAARLVEKPKNLNATQKIANKLTELDAEQLTIEDDMVEDCWKSKRIHISYDTLKDFIGETVLVMVDRVVGYGAFCRIVGTDVVLLAHISKLRPFYICDIEDVAKPGQKMEARIIFDQGTGRFAFSMKELYEEAFLNE